MTSVRQLELEQKVTGSHWTHDKNICFSSSLGMDDTRGSPLRQLAMALAVDAIRDARQKVKFRDCPGHSGTLDNYGKRKGGEVGGRGKGNRREREREREREK